MKQHPFTLSYQELKTSGNFDRQNEKNVRNLFPDDKGSNDDPLLSTQAVGEEGGRRRLSPRGNLPWR